MISREADSDYHRGEPESQRGPQRRRRLRVEELVAFTDRRELLETTHPASLGGRTTLPPLKGVTGWRTCPGVARTAYHGVVLYLTAPEDLAGLLPAHAPAYRADQLRRWLYATPVLSMDEMTNIPEDDRMALGEQLWPFQIEAEQTADGGTTRKWLFRAPDGAAIEAVLMGYPKRITLCISSQAGCALGCTFCATGQFGFERHLEPGEIYAQIAYASAYLRKHGLPGSPDRLTNIVFMGMGEPLANFRRVRESLRRIIDVRGMSARSVTVSTVGVVPGMLALAEEPWAIRLAVSLHAADDELRSTLVPLNDRYPIETVLQAAENYFAAKGRRVSLEWTLMEGVNDNPDQAEKLAAIAARLGAHINLIALNPTPLSPDRPSSSERIRRFMATLEDHSANATLRHMRGQTIDAACGQLRARQMTGSQSAPVAIASRSSKRLKYEPPDTE